MKQTVVPSGEFFDRSSLNLAASGMRKWLWQHSLDATLKAEWLVDWVMLIYSLKPTNKCSLGRLQMAMDMKELEAALNLLHCILSERWTPQRLDEHSWGFQYVAGWVPLSCYAGVNPQMEAFLFRAINPLPVEPARRGLVAEYITRVNYPLPVGNWAIDLDTGDVRWKSGLYFGGVVLGESQIRHIIGSSLYFVDQHAAGIAKLQLSGTVAEALATVGHDHGRGTDGMRQPG